MHDLRRTASTLLHEAGFNTDWIEKCLAHEQRGVRAVYNKAEYAEQRRTMLQAWADMLDGWIATNPKAKGERPWLTDVRSAVVWGEEVTVPGDTRSGRRLPTPPSLSAPLLPITAASPLVSPPSIGFPVNPVTAAAQLSPPRRA